MFYVRAPLFIYSTTLFKIHPTDKKLLKKITE